MLSYIKFHDPKWLSYYNISLIIHMIIVTWYFTVGVFLFSFLCVLGSCMFALGAHFQGTSAMLPIMLLGRLLFGSGNGSLTSKFGVRKGVTLYQMWSKLAQNPLKDVKNMNFPYLNIVCEP